MGDIARGVLSCLVSVVGLLSSGCYVAHTREVDAVLPDAGALEDTRVVEDTGLPCLADGIYETPLRVASQDPAGCIGAMPATTSVRIPPRVEDFVGMCGSPDRGTVTSTGACAWNIDVHCQGNGERFTAQGTMSAAGVVRARVEVAAQTADGHCGGVIVLGP